MLISMHISYISISTIVDSFYMATYIKKLHKGYD